jgi:tRNA uridine 5-carbamoylmethylation protein Kti12
MNIPFVIILSGPPAVGKNTIAFKICQYIPTKVAEINLDKIKFFVHKTPSTDEFLDLASEIGQSMMRIYLSKKLDIVIHKAFCSYQFVRPFINIADEMGAKCAYFKLTAPLDELLKRNHKRTRPTEENELKRIYDLNEACEHSQGTSIDTMKYNVDEAAEIVLERINENRVSDY